MKEISKKFIERARQTALKSVEESAEIALGYRNRLNQLNKEKKGKSSTTFVTEADLDVQKRVLEIIKREFPDHRYIAEEETSEKIRELNRNNSDSEFVWIIDPIDGTRKFLDKDSDYYGIAVALLKNGSPVLSVFYAPEYQIDGEEKGTLFEADSIRKTRVNKRKVDISSTTNLAENRSIISKTIAEKVPNWKNLLAGHFQNNKERTGSGTLSLCRVACSGTWKQPILYAFGETSILNIVPGGYIVKRAGGTCRDIYGDRIFPLNPDLLKKEKVCLPSIIAGNPQATEKFTSLVCACKFPQVEVLGYRAEGIKEIDPENPELKMEDLVSIKALERYSNRANIVDSVLSSMKSEKKVPDSFPVLEKLGRNLGRVIEKLLGWRYWKGVERIYIGGGLSYGSVGDQILESGKDYISEEVDLEKIYYSPEEAGLIGASYLAPREPRKKRLTLDIGGKRIRSGLISFPKSEERKIVYKDVRNWQEQGLDQDSLIELINSSVIDCLQRSRGENELSNYICISCPGMIDDRGNIIKGASNLPGDWTYPDFHLPSIINKKLKKEGYKKFKFEMRNDALAQGMSELPFVQDVKEWGVLTIGTGLGNARFSNTRV